MGVHKFYGVFVTSISNSLLREIPDLFGLIMDLNGFAHKVAQGIFGYGKTLEDLPLTADQKWHIGQMLRTPKGFEQLKLAYLNAIGPALTKIIIEKLKPTDFLIMTLDGKAPLAKGKQQLSRRTLSAIERHQTTDNVTVDQKFDTAYLTAGLPFMRDVSDAIERWIDANKALLPHYTLYSGCDVEGEGEHKIFEMLEVVRTEMIRANSGKTDKDIDKIFRNKFIGSYGLDADIGFLSAMRDYNFVWIREQRNINYIEDGVSIDNVRNHIVGRMLEGMDRSIFTREHEMNVISDFTVMTFTIGDDFVPAQFPMTINIKTAIEQMMYEYSQRVQTCGFLTSGDEINIPALTYIMEGMVEVEKKMYKMRQDVENAEMNFITSLNQTGQFDQVLYKKVTDLRKINGISSKEGEYYNSAPILSLSYEEYCEYWKLILRRPCLFSDNNVRSHKIETETYLTKEQLDFNCDDACQDYITGLRWNFAYYKGAKINNWFYKRSFPPTIHALYEFLKAGKYQMVSVLKGPQDFNITTTQMLAMTLNPTLNAPVIKSFFKTDSNYSNATINCRFLKVNSPIRVATSYQGRYKSEEHSKIPLIPQIIIEDILRIIPNPKLEVREMNRFKIYMGGRPGLLASILEKKEKKKAHVGIGSFNVVATIENKEDEERNMSSPSATLASNPERKSSVRYTSPPKMPTENVEETLNKLDRFMKTQGRTHLGSPKTLPPTAKVTAEEFIEGLRDRAPPTFNRGGRGAMPGGRGDHGGGRGRGDHGGGRGWDTKAQIKGKDRLIKNSMKVGKFREIRTNREYTNNNSDI